jgi:hypothetical protein
MHFRQPTPVRRRRKQLVGQRLDAAAAPATHDGRERGDGGGRQAGPREVGG